MRRKRIARLGRARPARRQRSASSPRAAAAATTRASASTEIEGLGSTLEEIQANAKDGGRGQPRRSGRATSRTSPWADEFTASRRAARSTRRTARSSDDMVDADADRRSTTASRRRATRRCGSIADGDVAPVNIDLIPNYADVFEGLKGQSYNTRRRRRRTACRTAAVPNLMIWQTDIVQPAPTAGASIWRRELDRTRARSRSTTTPIFIADAAVYLKATQPDLNITNPYELDDDQFNAAVDLLKQQRPNIGEYWAGDVREAGHVVHVRRQRRRHDVAVPGQPDWPPRSRRCRSTAISPEGGHDRLVGHVDDRLQGRPSELHVPLDGPHHLARRRTRRSRSTSARRPSNSKACDSDDGPEPLRRQYHADDEAYWENVYYWTTPVGGLRRRPRRGLQGPRGVATRPGPRSGASRRS